MHTSIGFAIAGLATSAMAGYTLNEDFMSGNFFDHFDFFDSPDPTHGFVNYVDAATANSQGYVNTQKGAYIGVDYTNVASSSGRNSVRLQSKSQTTEALIILDLAHMPGGVLGTWPAFWTVGPSWPSNGEIDIVEGVNNQNTNFMTFHSGNQACQINSKGASALNSFTSTCYAEIDGNVGCSYHDTNTASYGDVFNAQGGGVFAMEHTGNTISIWFFPRNADLSQVLSDNPNPQSWPAPRAQWLSTTNQLGTCDLSKEVQQQSIVFDTTFCGDWAGAAFDGGLGACNSFVKNNPSAFRDAFWQVNSLKSFTTNGQPSPAPATTSAVAPSSVAVSSVSMPSATVSSVSVSSVSVSSVSVSSVSTSSGPTTSTTSSTSQSAPASTTSSTSVVAIPPSSTVSLSSQTTTSSTSTISTVSTFATSTTQTSSSTTVPAATSAPTLPAPGPKPNSHESSIVPVAQSPTTTSQVVPATTLTSAAVASASDVPEDAIVGPDDTVYEIPDTQEHPRRSILLRKHGRDFTLLHV